MNILITGSNKGLGLEFVKQYADVPKNRVFACCRNPQQATKLQEIASEKVTIHKLAVTSGEDIANLKKDLEGQTIDILIHNAGIYGDKSPFGYVDTNSWIETMETNVFAPLKITEALIDNVAKSSKKTIAIITSKMGSISDNTSGGSYIYRSSKAAVNMVGKSMANDLKNKGITVILLHPGWVVTDMGGPNALIETNESISGMCSIIDKITVNETGTFWDYSGKQISW